VQQFGEERACGCELSRNMIIFPNLVINDIMAITVRTFQPWPRTGWRSSAWALGVRDEDERLRALRLFNFPGIPRPGGLATPDDVEALESCQRGYRNLRELLNDISKGMPAAPRRAPTTRNRCLLLARVGSPHGCGRGGMSAATTMAKAGVASVTRARSRLLYAEAALLERLAA